MDLGFFKVKILNQRAQSHMRNERVLTRCLLALFFLLQISFQKRYQFKIKNDKSLVETVFTLLVFHSKYLGLKTKEKRSFNLT